MSNFNVVIFIQGNLRRVDYEEMMDVKDSLELLDLSNNKIKSISTKIFAFAKLKVRKLYRVYT